MKKVFACLSAIVLMLVAFGLFAKPVMVSAEEVEEGKFIEDPTLEEGDLPIYVMNSIRTSFPALYDNNAKPDPNYQIGRDYYWNEIKLVVPRFEQNAPTGQQYTVYPQGNYDASKKSSAATKIYIWGMHEGEVKTGTVTGGTAAYTGQYAPLFGDVSLSGVRFNVSGQDVVINNVYHENGIGNGTGDTDYIYIIFDGQGKAVRGAAHDSYFVAANVAEYGFNPLFGLKDGKVVIREDIAGGAAVNGFGASDAQLDKEQIQVPNPDDPVLDPVTGEPMVDEETGEPLYNTMTVDGENPAYFMGVRYIWQWYSEEDFAEQKVNKVQYMEEGWLADRWDYAYADPNGGYVCLVFVPNLPGYAKTNDKQAAIHNASVRAMLAAQEISQEEADALLIAESKTVDPDTQEETISYTHVSRKVAVSFIVPVDGISYRYGYLDYAGAAVGDMHLNKWCKLWESGLLYGRHAEYRAYARTYNFSGAGLATRNAVVEGESYIIREENGKLLVEIKPGAVIKPSELIKIEGMLGGYAVAGKPAVEAGSNVAAVLTYKDMPVENLAYQLDINGEHIMWLKRFKYDSLLACLKDFAAEYAAYYGKGENFAAGGFEKWSEFMEGPCGAADWHYDDFFNANPQWKYVLDYYTEALANTKRSSGEAWGYDVKSKFAWRQAFQAFALQYEWGSWPYSPDFTNFDTTSFFEVCPEPDPFLYESMDECIAAFAEAYATYYGKGENFAAGGLAQWSTFMETPCNAATWHYDDFFNANPEWKFFLAYYTQEIANTKRSTGDAWAYDVTSKYAWRQAFQAWALKYEWGSWPYSPDFTNRSDEAYFIGINAVMPAWSQAQYIVPDTVQFMDTFTLDLDVSNSATGLEDKLQITFQMVKEFTPLIKIDESMLEPQPAGASIDLSKIFSAWDCTYKESGNGVFGSDISRQYLEIITPEGFDANNLKAGKWEIEAIAKCPNETGIVSKAKVVLTVLDNTAPKIFLANNGTVYLQAGAQLKPEDILLFAYDDLEGDYLASATTNWYLISCQYDPSDCVVGDVYAGTIRVSDDAGNEVKATFTLVLTGVAVEAEAPEDPNQSAEEEGAGCLSLTYVSSFIAAAGLALLILKKKH